MLVIRGRSPAACGKLKSFPVMPWPYLLSHKSNAPTWRTIDAIIRRTKLRIVATDAVTLDMRKWKNGAASAFRRARNAPGRCEQWEPFLLDAGALRCAPAAPRAFSDARFFSMNTIRTQ